MKVSDKHGERVSFEAVANEAAKVHWSRECSLAHRQLRLLDDLQHGPRESVPVVRGIEDAWRNWAAPPDSLQPKHARILKAHGCALD